MAKILVVDDNEINLKILVKLLGRQNHKLQEAHDGADALEKVNSSPPDLIITDMLMPVMDGQELIRRLRADPKTATVPIIIYSALYLARSAQGFAQNYGVSNILTKPSKPEVIIKAVNAVLGLSIQEEDPLTAAKHQLEAILEINRQLVLAEDPQRLLDDFCERAQKVIGAKCAFIGILDQSQQGFRQFTTSGIEVESARERLLPAARELLNRVLAERIPLRMRGDEAGPESAKTPTPIDRFDSLLGLPIATWMQPYGWLCLVDKLGASEFGEEEERLGGTLAALAAIVYENLVRYTQLKHKT